MVSEASQSAPRWAWTSFLGLCVVYLGLCLHYLGEIGPYVIDDVFIIFRYADNFAHGEGLVFNPGEAVEGYTSFLWTLLFGVFAKLGLPLILTGQVLGIALGLATLALTWRIARRLLPTLMRQDLRHALEAGVLPQELLPEVRRMLRGRDADVDRRQADLSAIGRSPPEQRRVPTSEKPAAATIDVADDELGV